MRKPATITGKIPVHIQGSRFRSYISVMTIFVTKYWDIKLLSHYFRLIDRRILQKSGYGACSFLFIPVY